MNMGYDELSDYSDDEYDQECMYESEELSTTKYNLVLCEIFNQGIHGGNDATLNYHYLVSSRWKKFDSEYIEDMAETVMAYYLLNASNNFNYLINHPIRNYRNIVTRTNYIQPQIAQCIYLPTQECICILKTFWIKLIQRKWKKIYAERQRIINLRKDPKCLRVREITGNWPENCRYFPGLRSMLI